jgi:hypothetical protein
MRDAFNGRIPAWLRSKLAECCARQGGTNGYALAADLIPKRGVPELQSSAARKLAREAFRGSRPR